LKWNSGIGQALAARTNSDNHEMLFSYPEISRPIVQCIGARRRREKQKKGGGNCRAEEMPKRR
jgi:hypothetical protein